MFYARDKFSCARNNTLNEVRTENLPFVKVKWKQKQVNITDLQLGESLTCQGETLWEISSLILDF